MTRAQILIVAAGLAGGLLVGLWPTLAGTALLACLGLGLLWLVCRLLPAPARRGALVWGAVTILLAAIIGAAVWSIESMRAPDAINYDLAAQYLLGHSDRPLGAARVAFFPGKQGYAYMLGGLYTVFGPSFYVALMGNAILLGLIVPIVGDTFSRLTGRPSIGWCGPLIALWPSLIFWGAQPLREAMVWLLCATVVNCTVRLVHRASLGPFLVAAAAVALLSTFRQYMSVLLAVALVSTLLLTTRGMGARARTIALVVLIGVPGALFLSQTEAIQIVLAAELDDVVATGATEAGSTTGILADLSSPISILRTVPLAVAAMLFGPPVWTAGSLTTLLGAVDGLAWIGLVILAIRGWRALPSDRARAAAAVVLPFLLTLGTLSIMVSNYGTIVRFRMELFVLLLPLVACGLHRAAPSGAGTTSSLSASEADPRDTDDSMSPTGGSRR